MVQNFTIAENRNWTSPLGAIPKFMVSTATETDIMIAWAATNVITELTNIHAEIQTIHGGSTLDMYFLSNNSVRPVLSNLPGTNFVLLCWENIKPNKAVGYQVYDLTDRTLIEDGELSYSDPVNCNQTSVAVAPYLTKTAFAVTWLETCNTSSSIVVSADIIMEGVSVSVSNVVDVSARSLDFRSDEATFAGSVAITTVNDQSVVAWAEKKTDQRNHTIYVALLSTNNSTLDVIDAEDMSGIDTTEGSPCLRTAAGQLVVQISWIGLDEQRWLSVINNSLRYWGPKIEQPLQSGPRKFGFDPLFSDISMEHEIVTSEPRYTQFHLNSTHSLSFPGGYYLETPDSYQPSMCRINSTHFGITWFGDQPVRLYGAIIRYNRREYATQEIVNSNVSMSYLGLFTVTNTVVATWVAGDSMMAMVLNENTFAPIGTVPVEVIHVEGIRNPIASATITDPKAPPFELIVVYEALNETTGLFNNYFRVMALEVVNGVVVFKSQSEVFAVGNTDSTQANTVISRENAKYGDAKPYSHIIVWEEIDSSGKSRIASRLVLLPGTSLSDDVVYYKADDPYDCQRNPRVQSVEPSTSTYALVYEEYDCENESITRVVRLLCNTYGVVVDVTSLAGYPVAMANPLEGPFSGELWTSEKGVSSQTVVEHKSERKGEPKMSCLYNEALTTGTDMWFSSSFPTGSHSAVLATAAGTGQTITVEGGIEYRSCRVAIPTYPKGDDMASAWFSEDRKKIFLWSSDDSFPYVPPETAAPTQVPTIEPTGIPDTPTQTPTMQPSSHPSVAPTFVPTGIPTLSPTMQPPPQSDTPKPTEEPTGEPTDSPTMQPSPHPSSPPTNVPTGTPQSSVAPTPSPSVPPTPSPNDTAIPTTLSPTLIPTTTDNTNTNPFIIIIIVIVVVIAVCCLAAIVFFIRRLRSRKPKPNIDTNTLGSELLDSEQEMWQQRAAKVSGSSTESGTREMLLKGSDMNWVTIRPLGAGSFGTVVLGMLEKDGSLLAVKTVPAQQESTVCKLREEISRMTRLSHPNVIKYIGEQYDKPRGVMHIFMEFIEGGSLHQMAESSILSEQTVSRLLRQALEGLRYIHSCGIIHRDIKGSNLLFTKEGRVVVADFGCSREDTGSAGSMTFAGTPPFIAPEIILTHGASENGASVIYKPPADIWSFGCTMVELLNRGRSPWPEFETSWACLFHMMNVFKEGGTPSEIPTNLSSTCRDVIDSILIIDPLGRPTASELLSHSFFNQVDTDCVNGEDVPLE
eukprot:TRINITY_DN350_c0_g1_i8.p1 TRINITY_DN350_c0_g1~~TRINITY_DN350_c0_g1_i8.p1  ORF type:complete len:1252 (+),score=234.96 TRINITY_DN350_c0_g1_i8:188-3943(+)